MPSIVLCLLLSCSRWFPPSLLCRLAIFCLVVPLISSLSLVVTLCSVWSTYCPSFLLYARPISTFTFIYNNYRIPRHNSRFSTLSSLRHEPSPTRTLKWPRRNRVQITCNTKNAYHVQHVVLHAMWYEGTVQLLSLTEFKSHRVTVY